MVISAQIVTTPMNKRFMMYLTMQHSSRSGFFSSEEAAERSVLAASLHLFTVFCFYNASSPRWPVRTRMTSATFSTKIFPSPIFPVHSFFSRKPFNT